MLKVDSKRVGFPIQYFSGGLNWIVKFFICIGLVARSEIANTVRMMIWYDMIVLQWKNPIDPREKTSWWVSLLSSQIWKFWIWYSFNVLLLSDFRIFMNSCTPFDRPTYIAILEPTRYHTPFWRLWKLLIASLKCFQSIRAKGRFGRERPIGNGDFTHSSLPSGRVHIVQLVECRLLRGVAPWCLWRRRVLRWRGPWKAAITRQCSVLWLKSFWTSYSGLRSRRPSLPCGTSRWTWWKSRAWK